MGKILFLYERDMASISITREEIRMLKKDYGFQSEFKYLLDVTAQDLRDHDVVMLMRPNDVYSPSVARAARESGALVIVFLDDDLLHLSAQSPSIPWRLRGLTKTLKQSHGVFSSSDYILDQYCPKTISGRRIRTDTIVQKEELSPERGGKKAGEPVRIVYAAGLAHAPLFEQYVLPAMTDVARSLGKKFSMTFVSVRPSAAGLDKLIDVSYKSGMKLMEYRKYMQEEQFDIGLAPLHEDDLSRCKYFNKYLEYTQSGVVSLYSRTEPYTDVIRDGINGFLADNTRESWREKLTQAIEDAALRAACRENARQNLLNDFTEESIMNRWLQGIPELIDPPRDRRSVRISPWAKARYYLYRPLDWAYLALFYFRKKGLPGLFNRIRMHIREGKAYSKRTMKNGGSAR